MMSQPRHAGITRQGFFIWAVLSDRPEIAAYLWEQVDDPLSSAITASAILTRMSDIQISLPYSDDDYIINARKFEQLAIGIIEKCHEANEEMAQKLVSFTQTRWNKSVIHMAAESHNKEFVSHPCCQGYVHAIWLNGLAARNILILFTLFFPILIPYLIGFKEMEEAVSKESSKISLYQKFRMYYKAPITKFYYFLVAYVMFLMLYSLFIMFYFRAEPSLVEYIVFTWVISFVIEEFTEILLSNSELTIKQCFKVWFKSGWNKFDVCVLVPSTLAFGLHWYPPAVEVSRSIYAVTCMLYYVRVLRLFSASTHLGPKMVMIWKMKDSYFSVNQWCVIDVYVSSVRATLKHTEKIDLARFECGERYIGGSGGIILDELWNPQNPHQSQNREYTLFMLMKLSLMVLDQFNRRKERHLSR
nr:transient receptor potential cation channel subfamily M member 2-like [Lytechinus pictus]